MTVPDGTVFIVYPPDISLGADEQGRRELSHDEPYSDWGKSLHIADAEGCQLLGELRDESFRFGFFI
jgi:hypothetical protein